MISMDKAGLSSFLENNIKVSASASAWLWNKQSWYSADTNTPLWQSLFTAHSTHVWRDWWDASSSRLQLKLKPGKLSRITPTFLRMTTGEPWMSGPMVSTPSSHLILTTWGLSSTLTSPGLVMAMPASSCACFLCPRPPLRPSLCLMIPKNP